MNTYNEELLLKIEKTLVLMGYGFIHPKKIAAFWNNNPTNSSEPWEMQVRTTLDALGVNHKVRRLPAKKKRPVLLYKDSWEAPIQILVEK